MAMALRVGAAVADVEFVQFHPTALHHASMPRPLLSEALRGHGAFLRDASGERFVDELQPRDIVSRAITAQLAQDGTDHVWLDATVLDSFDERFPTILTALDKVGLDPATDWLPVAPAAHYCCGGVVADLDGAIVAARACGWPARWPATASTAPTAWRRTRCSTAWSSGPGSSRRSTPARTAAEATGAMRCVLGVDRRRRGPDARIGSRPRRRPSRPTLAAESVADGRDRVPADR